MTANYKPLDAWSYSRWDSWRTCPKQFFAKHVAKTIPFEQSPAMKRGDDVHIAVASYLSRKTDVLPKEAQKFATLMAQLRSIDDKLVEMKWAFSRDWKATEYFAKGKNAAWLRVILDVGVIYPDNTADVVDHKTGKKYGSNDDQMELFALSTMAYAPWVQHATTRLWYLDIGDEDVAEFSRRDYEKLRAKWEGAVAPMFADTSFVARPNDKCRFCPLARSNGGDCKFG